MSEKEILYCAYYGILERLEREEKRLKVTPDSSISRHHYNKYLRQSCEIRERILAIEIQERHTKELE